MSSHASSSKSESSRPSNRHHQHRRHRSVRKPFLILHSLNAGFSFISICLFATIVPIWNANFFHTKGLLRGDWPDGLPILPLFLALVASLYYLINLFIARRVGASTSGDYLKSRNRSPLSAAKSFKIQLYLTLTILLLLVTFLVLAGISGLYRFWRPSIITTSIELTSGKASSNLLSTLSLRSVLNSNPSSLTPPTGTPPSPSSGKPQKQTLQSCTIANVFTRKCNPTIYLIGDLQIAAICTGALVWFLNLILLVLQAREFQYQRRKHQRSLRAKAKAKFDLLDDDISRAEKGQSPTKKKIHHERRERPGGHAKADSDPSTQSQASLNTDSSMPAPLITRPKRAYTAPSNQAVDSAEAAVRPKQHHYNPQISPSRMRSVRQQQTSLDMGISHNHSQTPYSAAVEAARRKVKPTETMRDWLAGRQG